MRGVGGGRQTCDGDCTGPGLFASPCECGVPIRGDGCIPSGDMLLVGWLPGLWSTVATDAGPGDGETNGAGLCNGELCWAVIGDDAVGDIIGD